VRAPGYGGTPGALCCRSGSPPIPAGTSQRYSKRSPLTVLFRLQVQKYFLTRLWLILAGPMASATQQFPGSKEERGGGISRHEACWPSEQFETFIWCTKTCSGSDALQRGNFQATYSFLHAKDGSVAYVNRFQKPAYWATDEITEDIQRHSQRLGSQPKIMKLSAREGLAHAVLAIWGKVRLEPLESEAVKLLGEGKKLQSGLLVDFIGDFSRSAREGLPVYRITGEAGSIWVASHDQDGRGILRFSAADPSTYSAPSAPTPGNAGRGGEMAAGTPLVSIAAIFARFDL
jgi:hypothetical protein